MHRERLDIPTHRQGNLEPSDQVDRADAQRSGAVPMIVGTIRWHGIGMPRGPLDQAFGMLVERLEVTKPEDRYPAEPHPFDCSVTFSDSTDEQGPAVAFAVRGLSPVGFKSYPLDGHGHNMNGGYILTPSIEGLWGGPLEARSFLSPLEFSPAKQGAPLTEEDPIVTMNFTLAPR